MRKLDLFFMFFFYKKKKKPIEDTKFSNNAPFSAPPRALREVFCKYFVFKVLTKKSRDAVYGH